MAVTSSKLGWNRAKAVPSYAVSGEEMSRLCLEGGTEAVEETPPHTISTSSRAQPVSLHSKLGFSSI